MLRILIILTVLLLGSCWMFAQSNQEEQPFSGCGSAIMMTQQPEIMSAQARLNAKVAADGAGAYRPAHARVQGSQALRVLPVVVHIIHNNGPENISDAQVQQGINQLNAAFSAQFGTGVNTEIQFCLAQQSPQGLVTNGITRDVSLLTNMTMETEDLSLKNINRWSPTCYINIWLVNGINSLSSGSGVAGYAYFPSSHGSNLDGIVMETNYFGSSQANTSVLVHEMGHYLGLYHTFESGCGNNNCLLDGDSVCDTPPDQTTFSSCSPNANSCNTDADDPSSNNPFTTDVPDLGENYMDYSAINCYKKITQGQSDRMNWHLSNVRSSLLACRSCQSPCPAAATANILLPLGPVTVNVGDQLNFSGAATNANAYSWRLSAGATFSSALTGNYQFNAIGNYWVVFEVASDNSTLCDGALDSVLVTVKCGANAAFSTPNDQPNANTNVVFSNLSSNAISYEWQVNGVTMATTANYVHNFSADGVYLVTLIASNGLCNDTTARFIYVGCKDESKRANYWYFGQRAGISFTNGSPVALLDGALGTPEGVATMSDKSGNLLFYSDGTNVWNRNHVIMANGNGLFGSPISAQSCIIVPAPGSVSRYYIFTVSNWTDSQTRLSYSVVDMTLNGSLGGVVAGQKNIVINANVAEQVTAVYHKNCEDIWIVAHERNNNTYQSYLLTTVGLVVVPVSSSTGNLYAGANRYGGLRASHNGKWLCSTLGGSSPDGITATISRFDAASGSVTHVANLENTTTLPNAYSAEFSVNDQVLYLVEFNNTILRQYDMSSANIALSGQTILTGSTRVNALQMGPDSKIYACGSQMGALSVINNPNVIGTGCNFVANAVPLGGRTSSIGLPNFFPNYFLPPLVLSARDTICQQENTLIRLGSNQCNATYEWSLNPAFGSLTILSDTLVNFVSNGTAGQTQVQVVRTTACAKDTAYLSIFVNNCEICPSLQLDAGKDTSLCFGQPVQLQATNGFDGYQWSPATGLSNPNIANPVASPLVPTTYTVTASKTGNEMVLNGDFSQGNFGFSSGYVFGGAGVGHYWISNNPSSINGGWAIPADHSPSADGLMLIVDGDVTSAFPVFWEQNVSLPANTTFTLQFWVAMAYFAQPPMIQVELNGVISGNYIPLGGPPSVGVWQPFSFTFNSGPSGNVTLAFRDMNTSYLGNDFAVDDISIRALCSYTDDVKVTPIQTQPKVLDLGPDLVACSNAVRVLDAGAGFLSYRWQNGIDTRTFTAFDPGVYWVTVKDSCNQEQSDTIRISLAAAPSIELGPDKTLCLGDSTQLSFNASAGMSTYNWVVPLGLSCSNCPDPWAKPAQSTTYYLAASTQDGCTTFDSIRVSVGAYTLESQTVNTCKPYVLGNQTYSSSGIYRDTFPSSSGCDSIFELNLTIVPTLQSTNIQQICQGESVVVGNSTYTSTGTYLDSLQTLGGCDSLVHTQLTVLPAVNQLVPRQICAGGSISVGTHTYTSAGMYVDTLQTYLGCDSIIRTQLSVLPTAVTDQAPVLCQGESLMVGTRQYTMSGSYRDTLQALNGCDSIVRTQLTILPAAQTNLQPAICQGELFAVGVHSYATSGTYRDTLSALSGCDSIIVTQLTVLQAVAFQNTQNICAGESISVGMHTYNAAGVYRDTLQAVNGCDSIVTTQLSVLQTWAVTQAVNLCPGEALLVGTNSYQAAGTYIDTLQSSIGCDSIITSQINLLMVPVTTNTWVICAGESISVGQHVYQTSGVYSDTLQASSGCDSLVVSNVTVNPTQSISQQFELCTGSSVVVGMHQYTSSGIYRDTLQNAFGCDSIVTTSLLISPEVIAYQAANICTGEQYPVGIHLYQVSGIYRDTLLALGGCDSIITTELTVLPVVEKSQNIRICAGETVSAGTNVYGLSGNYVDVLQSNVGCDSTVYSAVEVLDTALFQQEYVFCEGDMVKVGSKIYDKPGQYTDLFASSQGCDSTVVTRIAKGDQIYCDSLNCSVFIPNAFAPNVAGNDYFEVFTPVSQILELSVYDRWGDLMYLSKGNDSRWDGSFNGQPVNPGVYVYIVKGQCQDGRSFSRTGEVTVLR